MQLNPEEIDTIDDIGMLNGHPVKMLRFKGGFFCIVGNEKGKSQPSPLATGSHPAIAKFALSKQYPDFQPSMMKSEHYSDTSMVEKHSHFLSNELRKSGHDLYSVQDGQNIDFHITKYNINISSVKANIENNNLVIKDIKMPKEFSRAMAGATSEKAISCNVKKILIG